MSERESDALVTGSAGYISADMQSRPQRSQRIDYRLLNDRSDKEADIEDRAKRSRLDIPSDKSELLTPEELVS